ncbi:Asp23/Gls24 family envelope stress response protein [Spiroplasma chinense]|uniref:Asp23/Gls24 family envelope stress response protein n=1 Tax=Spiroplasma chinense TaxID=216932 RepID=A0A5B9Y796_9MOLU|nr:Asp23/Gls24 family envelope stress response protein [Spiroplasma chinense]QEH62177.1 Asp23/Gls24 family envelope stress response protein [Spiroplasma chinense]
MIDQTVYDAISNAVVTVPGVISFANCSAKSQSEIKTSDIKNAVEITSADNIGRVKIHIILINGVNIRDVVNEVQIRVKYELEKLNQFVRNYIVDVAVDDLEII